MINEMKISSRGPKIIVQSEEKLCVGVRLSGLSWGDRITVFKARVAQTSADLPCVRLLGHIQSHTNILLQPGALNFTLLSPARPGLNTLGWISGKGTQIKQYFWLQYISFIFLSFINRLDVNLIYTCDIFRTMFSRIQHFNQDLGFWLSPVDKHDTTSVIVSRDTLPVDMGPIVPSVSCESVCDTGPHNPHIPGFKEPGQAPVLVSRRLFSAPPDFSPRLSGHEASGHESGNDTCEGGGGPHYMTPGLPLQYLGRGPDF